MAKWAVSSQRMRDHFGAKSTNWLAGYRNCQHRFQFHQSRLEPWNEVETSVTSGQMHTKENRVHVESIDKYECQWRSSKFWCKRVDLLRLMNNCQQQSCRYTHGSVLVVWKPLTLNKYCALWTEKSQILKTRTTNIAERENFGPLPLKCQWIIQATFYLNKHLTLTFVDFFKESTSIINSNISEIQLEVHTWKLFA